VPLPRRALRLHLADEAADGAPQIVIDHEQGSWIVRRRYAVEVGPKQRLHLRLVDQQRIG
jgi:hypothetical protein